MTHMEKRHCLTVAMVPVPLETLRSPLLVLLRVDISSSCDRNPILSPPRLNQRRYPSVAPRSASTTIATAPAPGEPIGPSQDILHENGSDDDERYLDADTDFGTNPPPTGGTTTTSDDNAAQAQHCFIVLHYWWFLQLLRNRGELEHALSCCRWNWTEARTNVEPYYHHHNHHHHHHNHHHHHHHHRFQQSDVACLGDLLAPLLDYEPPRSDKSDCVAVERCAWMAEQAARRAGTMRCALPNTSVARLFRHGRLCWRWCSEF